MKPPASNVPGPAPATRSSKPRPPDSARAVDSEDAVSPATALPAAPSRAESPWPARIVWGVVIAASTAAYFTRGQWWPLVEPLFPAAAAKAPRAPRPTTVATATARLRDVPIYLAGLGTVTAYKTVTVRSRVEGELIAVAFTEGQQVRQGDLLAEIDPRPSQSQLQQAEGQLARDQANLKSATLTLNRYRQLAESKIVTAQQIDEQISLVQQAEAAVQADQAGIDNARLQIEYCRITAPISGRIGLRLVDTGNIIRANDPTGIAVITQLQPISLVFSIPQDELAAVHGQLRDRTDVVVDAFDRSFEHRIASGTLSAIDNQVDPATGTVRLKAVFPNDDERLFPNQFVNARLLVETLRDRLVVPSAAVQRGPNGPFVYLLQRDETVALRYVEPGLQDAGETVIQSGLQAGDVVVTAGLDKLQDGAAVNSGSASAGKGTDTGRRGAVGGAVAPAASSVPGVSPPEAAPAGAARAGS